MNFKIIEIDSGAQDPSVELRFAVASHRAGGDELLRIDIPKIENEKDYNKFVSSVIRTLKVMKEERLIQFFATKDSFLGLTTEAEFLLNKYPSVFADGLTDKTDCDFVYIKI